ncbi:MAG: P-type conjugative transfer ATPase TrbB [Hyphomonadaceae bacterium]|nr:P-type conjugative transfer ATPase TrbB [Hyphomonadaceae bacterium]
MSALTVSLDRRRTALSRALGPAVAAAIAQPDVVEALINADGQVWLDRVGVGLVQAGVSIPAMDREAAIRLLAHEAGDTVSPDRPMLSTILPDSAARIQAVLPPLVDAPVLSIRKRPTRIYSLDDYVRDEIASASQVAALRVAIGSRRNIVVAGGTGSGKTTLLNAILAEPAFLESRVVILEDTSELQCASPNCVQLLTKRTEPPIGMRELVQMTLRLRPDRIVVGEVRDRAALEVLKAWNTGHPGGLLTLHANSAMDALGRIEDLTLEGLHAPPKRLIASAIDVVVFIERTLAGRRVTEIVEINGAACEPYQISNVEAGE